MRNPVSGRSLALAVAMIMVASCGGGKEVAELTVNGAWARPTPQGASAAAVYLTVESPVADRLLKVSTPIGLDATVHGPKSDPVAGGGHHGAPGEHHNGGTEFEIAAGGEAAMAPGGMHIMIEGLTEPLREGDSFPVVLVFRDAGEVRVNVLVALNGPG